MKLLNLHKLLIFFICDLNIQYWNIGDGNYCPLSLQSSRIINTETFLLLVKWNQVILKFTGNWIVVGMPGSWHVNLTQQRKKRFHWSRWLQNVQYKLQVKKGKKVWRTALEFSLLSLSLSSFTFDRSTPVLHFQEHAVTVSCMKRFIGLATNQPTDKYLYFSLTWKSGANISNYECQMFPLHNNL